MSRRGSALTAVAAAVVLLAALVGQRWAGGPASSPRPASDAAVAEALAAAPAGSALRHIAQLEVRGRAARTGYERERFGAAWADVDGNGCDTRNDVLARDLTGVVLGTGAETCVVLRGTLHEPYRPATVPFVRGPETSGDVQIDHVVALSDAWQKGAQQWDVRTRTAFANDPLNLLAVDGQLNEQKSDADAATWLPPSRTYRCAYVARQVAVKYDYGLWVSAAERVAMVTVLRRCPGQLLPP